MIVFNTAGLLIGLGCFLLSLIVGVTMGWNNVPTANGDPPFYDPFPLAAELLAVTDLAWRLRGMRTLTAAGPSTVLTRQGLVPARPRPVVNALNMFFSGEKGAQYFWILPRWIAGLLLVCAGIVQRSYD